jgi:hypothetical protein
MFPANAVILCLLFSFGIYSFLALQMSVLLLSGIIITIQREFVNMENPVPDIPSFKSKDFLRKLKDFGHFLENNCRPGAPYDLGTWPNPVWQKFQNKLLKGLENLAAGKVCNDQLCMLQGYNSGIIIKSSHTTLGFDLVPVPEYYNWPDSRNLTEKTAEAIDALFITHAHQDHFNLKLIKLMNAMNKPVYSHPEISLKFSDLIKPCPNEAGFYFNEFKLTSRFGIHVWREDFAQVPLVYFEVETPDNFNFIVTGDNDYCKTLECKNSQTDLLFITWRNPSCLYENGHPEQKGTTLDAFQIAIDKVKPMRIVLQHYAELDHIYKGFSASYEIAEMLIKSGKVKTDIFMPGEVIFIK